MFRLSRPCRRILRTVSPFLATFAISLLLPARGFAQALDNKDEGPGTESSTELFINGATFQAPLRDVPESATVVQEERFIEKGEINFQYEIESIPNMMYSGGTSRPRFLLIRGIGEFEQYEGAPNPSVGTIIDDIDFSGLGILVPMFDVEQVEVLRGPQGIRYGSSALAGAVNVRSNDPTEFTTGRLELMGGNDDLLSGGFAVGGEVPGSNGKLLMRISAFGSQSDGFRDNQFYDRDDTNKRDESILRLKLRYRESAKLSFDFTAWGTQASNGFDAFAIDNSRTTQSDRPGQDATQSRAGAFKVTSRPSDALKLEAITAAAQARINYSFDGDWGNNPFWAPYDPYDYYSDSSRLRRMYSEEIRLSSDDPMYEHGESYRWLSGIYLQRLTEGTSTSEYANNEIYDSLDTDYAANQWSLFGDIETPLGNGTSIATGLRVEQRGTSYSDSRGSESTPNFTMLGGAVTLQKDVTDAIRSYLSVSRGYKGGGFNAGPSVPSEDRQYNPEYLWNFEAGTKGAFLKRRLESNLAVFYDLRRDTQMKFAIQDDPNDPLAFTYVTDSSGHGQSAGLELENAFHATPWIDLFASGSLLTSEYTEVPSEAQYLQGRAFSYAPPYQYSAGTRVLLGGGLFARIEETGKGSYYFDDSNDQKSKPYDLFNATLGYRYEKIQILLWGRNLFNQVYAVRGFYFGNEPPDYPNKLYIQQGDPRAFGLTVSAMF